MSGTPLTDRIAAEHAELVRALPRLPAAARRRAAMAALAADGLPVARDENWKYANLRPLERLRFAPVVVSGAGAALPAASGAELPPAIAGFTRQVFVDGVFAPAPAGTADTGRGLLTPLASIAADASAAAPDTPRSADERFALLNDAFATDGALVRIPAAATEPVRLELVFLATADALAGASYPRIELHLAAGTRAVLIERHVGAGASFVNSAVSVALERGAALQHYRFQDLGARAIVLDTLSATLAQDALYRLHAVSSGAQSARSTLHVRLAGERAELALALAALGDRQQVQDAYALVEHLVPRARTVQTFRGIAAGRARVACNGKIRVAREACGTDSRQSLRGLLAGPEAEIDLRPQLEIQTDEVRCSHGATAGKLDEGMLFYLLSRGLDRAAAERALKWAFLEDVIAQIEVPELRRQIEQRIAAQMQDAAALREMS